VTDVRVPIIGLCLLVIASASHTALAVTYPATTLLSGEVGQTVLYNQCYIVRGASTFQRNTSANRAFISISEMTAAGYQLNGKLNLTFTDSTTGTVHFGYAAAYPSDIQDTTFANYSQTYNATSNLLTVHFTLGFPSCALQVDASYLSP